MKIVKLIVINTLLTLLPVAVFAQTQFQQSDLYGSWDSPDNPSFTFAAEQIEITAGGMLLKFKIETWTVLPNADEGSKENYPAIHMITFRHIDEQQGSMGGRETTFTTLGEPMEYMFALHRDKRNLALRNPGGDGTVSYTKRN